MKFPSPCGVNIVGNLAAVTGTATIALRAFPSPCGVNIVGNQQSLRSQGLLLQIQFPSPCGVNIVGNFKPLVLKATESSFRPLAG